MSSLLSFLFRYPPSGSIFIYCFLFYELPSVFNYGFIKLVYWFSSKYEVQFLPQKGYIKYKLKFKVPQKLQPETTIYLILIVCVYLCVDAYIACLIWTKITFSNLEYTNIVPNSLKNTESNFCGTISSLNFPRISILLEMQTAFKVVKLYCIINSYKSMS